MVCTGFCLEITLWIRFKNFKTNNFLKLKGFILNDSICNARIKISWHFHTHFSSQRVCRNSCFIRRLEIPHYFQQRLFCLLHSKTEPSEVGNEITLSGPWSTTGSLSFGCFQYDLPRQSLLGHSVHVVEPS